MKVILSGIFSFMLAWASMSSPARAQSALERLEEQIRQRTASPDNPWADAAKQAAADAAAAAAAPEHPLNSSNKTTAPAASPAAPTPPVPEPASEPAPEPIAPAVDLG